MISTPARLLAPLALLSVLAACSSTGEPNYELAPEINSTFRNVRATLGPGDLLSVKFTQNLEWNHDTQVKPDGYASFLGLDDVLVAGMTLDEVDAKLEDAYKTILAQPELTILPTELSGRSIIVLGAVGTAGTQDLDQPRVTLLDAIGRAGGPDIESAYMGRVFLLRWMPEEGKNRHWEIDLRNDNWGKGEPILLQPYDLVYVPPKAIVKVNIWIKQYLSGLLPFPQLIRY